MDLEIRVPRSSFKKKNESNTNAQSFEEPTATDDPILVELLTFLKGRLNNLPVKILKDEGCNTKK